MSSVLAMILAAGMVVGDGTGKVSGEVRQRLDLRGEWEGDWVFPNGDSCHVFYRRGSLRISVGENLYVEEDFTITDRGEGKARVTWSKFLSAIPFRGIYECADDRVIICCSVPGVPDPTSFRAGKDRWLLILHRVKPGKR